LRRVGLGACIINNVLEAACGDDFIQNADKECESQQRLESTHSRRHDYHYFTTISIAHIWRNEECMELDNNIIICECGMNVECGYDKII
jgi:hypothetical protein